MTTLLSLLLSITSLTTRVLPQGTQLHIRLTTTVGSYASVPGSPVSALVIAPVIVDGRTVLEAGSTLHGKVKSVTRVGFGLRHEEAGLNLEFNELIPPEGDAIPVSTRVTEVENARESVNQKGRIEGVRSTSSMCYRVSGYIRALLQWEIHAEIAEWAIRSIFMQLPEPEIYYPAGVELTLTLTQPLILDGTPSDAQPPTQLAEDEREKLTRVAEEMPYQTYTPRSRRSSDITNVLVIGSHDQILTAFDAAGWTQANRSSLRYRVNLIRAEAENRGDDAAPMSSLLLDGASPDMSWQKGLNDVSKRHHVRLWKADETWDGREMWMGAATRDVGFAYMRPGKKLTHKIDENVDQERDKVAYDLAFTSCANIFDWTDRADVPHYARNATGDPIVTDGRIVVIELEDCPAPRLSTETVDSTLIPEHGDKLQRFARREILSARNELLRTNPYWRTYEGSRWMVESVVRRHRRTHDVELLSTSAAAPHAAAVRLPASAAQ